MIGAVARRAVAVAVPAVLARQQPVERVQHVVVRSGPDLDDDEARRRVRDEHRQQAVLARAMRRKERSAGRGQVAIPRADPVRTRRASRESLREDAPKGVADAPEAAAPPAPTRSDRLATGQARGAPLEEAHAVE